MMEAIVDSQAGQSMAEFDFLGLLKKYWPLLLVFAFMIFGFWLRAYHLDYPSIGYHNWKENRYLGPARNFVNEGFFAYGFFVPAYDFPQLFADPSGAHSDLFPYSSIFAALMFFVFGFELWAARLPVVLFGVAAIPLVYFILKRVFKREDMALVASFLTAINPLFVFFAHNVDQMPFGLAFSLLGLYFYVRWVEEDRMHQFVLAALFVAAGVNAKYTYLIIGVPMLFLFPWSRLKDWRAAWKTYVAGIAAFSIFPAWLYYSNTIIASRYRGLSQGDLSRINPLGNLFSAKFWDAISMFAADNYTLLVVLFAALGLVAFVFFYKGTSQGKKFVWGNVAGLVLFFILFSQNMAGHNYHQFPIAMVVILLAAYFFVFCGGLLALVLKNVLSDAQTGLLTLINVVAIVVMVMVVYSPSIEAKNRMFDTQFPGLDVAGEYIASHKAPGERVMHSSHQAYGLLWHGNIKGTRGIPPTLSNITFVEEQRNARWLFIYNWDFGIFDDTQRWPYLSEHYSLRQVGFLKATNGAQPVYFLLYRDEGGFNLTKLDSYTQGKPVKSRSYEFSDHSLDLYYIDLYG